MTERYRVAYDRLFLANSPDGDPKKELIVDGVPLTSLSLNVEIQAHSDKGGEGHELLFEKDEKGYIIEFVDLSKYFRVCIDPDREKGYSITLEQESDILFIDGKREKYWFTVKPISATFDTYTKSPMYIDDIREISLERLSELLKEHMEWFDNIDNKPAQNLSISAIPVNTRLRKGSEFAYNVENHG